MPYILLYPFSHVAFFQFSHIRFQAGAPGFEPGSTDPKSGVLPLHHAPMSRTRGGYAELYHTVSTTNYPA
jgi:hypothetical protein